MTQASQQAAEAHNAANMARISQLEAIIASRPEQSLKISPLEHSLLKSLTDLPQFEGTTARTWEDFEKEFRNKAAQIPSLTQDHWVRYIHSRLGVRAIEHARTKNLIDSHGNILVTNFDAYCSAMRTAAFGNQMSVTAKLIHLMNMTQSGHLSDPMEFLREKERYLNQIPDADMAGYVRAAITLKGMDPALVTAISPNPSSVPPADGLYYSYADVRQQVVAVMGTQQMVLQSVQQGAARKLYIPPPPPKFNSTQPRTPVVPAPPVVTSNKFSALSVPASSPGQVKDYSKSVCVDCGQLGHGSKYYHKCPQFVPGTTPVKKAKFNTNPAVNKK
jgi:hypothetical protein